MRRSSIIITCTATIVISSSLKEKFCNLLDKKPRGAFLPVSKDEVELLEKNNFILIDSDTKRKHIDNAISYSICFVENMED